MELIGLVGMKWEGGGNRLLDRYERGGMGRLK